MKPAKKGTPVEVYLGTIYQEVPVELYNTDKIKIGFGDHTITFKGGVIKITNRKDGE